MKEFNYFKLLQFPKVQMMGFKEVKGFIYVSISRISPLIVVYNKKIEKRDYRFRVDFENAEKKITILINDGKDNFSEEEFNTNKE